MMTEKRLEGLTGIVAARSTWLLGLPVLLVMLLSRSPAVAAPPRAIQPPTRYMIVVTGGELLEGAYADGHTHFLTRTLRPLGLRCVGSMSVDDKKDDINEALRFATGKAALVIVTGGLGPTDNDITRETLAGFSEIALHEHPDVLREMQRRFNASPDQLRRHLRRQAQVPTHGTYLKNSNGTAVGLVFEGTDTVIVALPGPPRELQPMVRDELVPYLSQRFGTRLPGCALTLRFVGIGQSRIDQTLEDDVALSADITVSSQFERGRVDFTFSMPDDTAELRAQLEELKRKILRHLGEYVYADDGLSLEAHIVKRLESRGETITIAEAGSGGSFTAGFTTADGALSVLAGAYVAPTEEKVRKLIRVPDQDWLAATSNAGTAKLLAAAAADATSCEWAVAIGEAQEDNDGARFAEVVFKRPDGRVESQRHRLRGSDESGRSRLTTQILDDLRRRLK